MVPNPHTQQEKSSSAAVLGRRQLKDTLQRHSSKKLPQEIEISSRPVSRFSNSMSVDDLNQLTRQMNLQTRKVEKQQLFRSHSAPIETNAVTHVVSDAHKAYRSYSDRSSSSSSSANSSSSLDCPPSRYHFTKNFNRRVKFNEAVQVYELPRIEVIEDEHNILQSNGRKLVPYTKTRMKIKNDTVKFQEIKSIKRPATRRLQSRMTSYVRDKLKGQ